MVLKHLRPIYIHGEAHGRRSNFTKFLLSTIFISFTKPFAELFLQLVLNGPDVEPWNHFYPPTKKLILIFFITIQNLRRSKFTKFLLALFFQLVLNGPDVEPFQSYIFATTN